MSRDHSDDPLARIFAAPAEPLTPPEGHFDEVVRRARRRRTVRTLAAAAAVALVAGLGVGVAALTSPGGTDTLGSYANGGAQGDPDADSGPVGSTATPAPGGSAATDPSPTPSALPRGSAVPAGFQPWSVTSVGGGVRYVLGAAPCDGGSCPALARTVDGGKRWAALPAPRAELPNPQLGGAASPSVAIRDVRFASPRDGWAYGGALYATHDGAARWHRIDVGGSVLDLATDGATTYAVVASCNAQGLTCQDPRLLSSPAGSDDWRPVAGVQRSGDAYGSTLSLSADQAVVQLGSGTAARIFRRDGERWTTMGANPCGERTSDLVAASASGPQLFAFCTEGAAGSLILTGYRFEDGSWTAVGGQGARVPDGGPGNVTVTAASARLLFVAATSPDLGGALQESEDGGRTWHDAAVPARPEGWRYVGASGASTIVAVPAGTADSIFVTFDGGQTWQKENIS